MLLSKALSNLAIASRLPTGADTRNVVPRPSIFYHATVPAPDEQGQIATAEGLIRSCHRALQSGGSGTTASEDILALRASRLRRALHDGVLSWGGYSYGLLGHQARGNRLKELANTLNPSRKGTNETNRARTANSLARTVPPELKAQYEAELSLARQLYQSGDPWECTKITDRPSIRYECH